jgi:glycosyltransferase involved in cell wall biosynthesis
MTLPTEKEMLLTVVVPCYGQAGFLQRSVGSIAEQKGSDEFEVLVIDDGNPSEEECRTAVAKLHESFPHLNIRLIRQENKGLSGARNTGFREATAEYVYPLDADDWLEGEDYLSSCLEVARSQNVGVVYTNVKLMNTKEVRQMQYDIDKLCLHNCFVSSCLISKATWQTCGGYDEAMRQGYEDWNFWLTCVEKGIQFAKSERGVFVYDNTREDSMVQNAYQNHEVLYPVLVSNHPCLFPQGKKPPESVALTVMIALCNEPEALSDLLNSLFQYGKTLKFNVVVIGQQNDPSWPVVERVKHRRVDVNFRCVEIENDLLTCLREEVWQLSSPYVFITPANRKLTDKAVLLKACRMLDINPYMNGMAGMDDGLILRKSMAVAHLKSLSEEKPIERLWEDCVVKFRQCGENYWSD